MAETGPIDPEREPTLDTDTGAPYGRKLDGTPKRAPGGRPPSGGSSGKRRAPSSKQRPGGPLSPPSKTASRKTRDTDYRPGLIGLAQIAALPLRYVSPIDCAAVMVIAPELAEGINETAKERPEIAALCDRALQVGPYGLIIAPLLKLGAQVAENHRWLPSETTRMLGAVSRDELAAMLDNQAPEQAAPTAA